MTMNKKNCESCGKEFTPVCRGFAEVQIYCTPDCGLAERKADSKFLRGSGSTVYGLTESQTKVLEFICHSVEVSTYPSIAELAIMVDKPEGTVRVMISRMEERGAVKQIVNEQGVTVIKPRIRTARFLDYGVQDRETVGGYGR